MSDTPETDAFFFRIDIDWDMEVEFARKLERERDEARNEIEGCRNKWECAVTMAAQAENERDEVLMMIDKITEIGIDLMDKNRSLKREIKKLKKSSNHKL